jgi:ATP-dependent DNA helicase RecQ
VVCCNGNKSLDWFDDGSSSIIDKKEINSIVATGITNDDVKQAIVDWHYQIIFTSPELILTNKKWSNVFECLSPRLVAVVIDEAHCVKKW